MQRLPPATIRPLSESSALAVLIRIGLVFEREPIIEYQYGARREDRFEPAKHDARRLVKVTVDVHDVSATIQTETLTRGRSEGLIEHAGDGRDRAGVDAGLADEPTERRLGIRHVPGREWAFARGQSSKGVEREDAKSQSERSGDHVRSYHARAARDAEFQVADRFLPSGEQGERGAERRDAVLIVMKHRLPHRSVGPGRQRHRQKNERRGAELAQARDRVHDPLREGVLAYRDPTHRSASTATSGCYGSTRPLWT